MREFKNDLAQRAHKAREEVRQIRAELLIGEQRTTLKARRRWLLDNFAARCDDLIRAIGHLEELDAEEVSQARESET